MCVTTAREPRNNCSREAEGSGGHPVFIVDLNLLNDDAEVGLVSRNLFSPKVSRNLVTCDLPLDMALQVRDTGTDFLDFLKHLALRYRKKELHVILDNSSTHTTPAVMSWLADNPPVHFHFTPKGASWLNMIEAWFGILTRKSLRRGSFASVRALVRHISAYLAHWNENPTPFVRTKNPAEIIKKALRHAR